MDKFTQLCAGCSNSVQISVNNHRDYYQSASDYLQDQANASDAAAKRIPGDIFIKCVETNTIVYVHFYPDGATTSYSFYHYDVEMALDEALKVLKDHRNG